MSATAGPRPHRSGRRDVRRDLPRREGGRARGRAGPLGSVPRYTIAGILLLVLLLHGRPVGAAGPEREHDRVGLVFVVTQILHAEVEQDTLRERLLGGLEQGDRQLSRRARRQADEVVSTLPGWL